MCKYSPSKYKYKSRRQKSVKKTPPSLKSKNLIKDFGVNKSYWKFTLEICVVVVWTLSMELTVIEINKRNNFWHFFNIFFFNFKLIFFLSAEVCWNSLFTRSSLKYVWWALLWFSLLLFFWKCVNPVIFNEIVLCCYYIIALGQLKRKIIYFSFFTQTFLIFLYF